MYLETVEEILENKEKIVVPDGEGGGKTYQSSKSKGKRR
ncbi:MAG: hypothetical protein CM1200mP1_02650 [Candidatus Neomarinimicrobiota bacterium]|nr:MAG: hypothetical protein CM1200mP1_02650 [Candidatus Neomarinimicrobiota bacterium]